jgi:intracellular multiplication protein IcmB
MALIDPLIETLDSLMAWFTSSMKQTTESYCDIETADDTYTLVGYDGSLATVVKVSGVTHLIGREEFNTIHDALTTALQGNMKKVGHVFQFFFHYDKSQSQNEIKQILEPCKATADRLNLSLEDLFEERIDYIGSYCGHEEVYLVLWSRPALLSGEQSKKATKDKLKRLREHKVPPMKDAQNFLAAIPEIRNEHDSFTRSVLNDLSALGVDANMLEVHDAIRAMRNIADPEFTDNAWRPVLPGDKIPARDLKNTAGKVSDILWPPLGKQILPRDVLNLDLKTCRVGDRLYGSIFIDLFPQEIKPFAQLFKRIMPSQIPWRMSYLVQSDGLKALRFKSMVASVLSFASSQNRLISNASTMLRGVDINTDDAVVSLQVSLSSWAPVDQPNLLRTRVAALAKALQGWGNCEVSEVCGDAFAGAVSSMMGVGQQSVATRTIAPLRDVIYMLPFTRPSSPWDHGAMLFRSPDGKPWPYQPGSSKQTTWIDLYYARPGSGKSVLSNSINLGLCLSPGIQRLPRIAIIDIGPSSAGLISLIKEALPKKEAHLAAHYRLEMTKRYAVNPFDTQLGCRQPTAVDRSFLVNFLTLLATPIGAEKTYDGMSDMIGLIIDEAYKLFGDHATPRIYTAGSETVVDDLLNEIGFVKDEHTTWWEVTDALFVAGFVHEATLAQRFCMPLLADTASVARTKAVQDLYGEVKTPTGETLVAAFARMISSAVREYTILSRVTSFDIGEARIVSLDLDEVAKTGGDAADRQTAVMYMLARYIMARHFFLNDEVLQDAPEQYHTYHHDRIQEIREVPKRIVFDEFHRTSKAQSVRDQVIVDMREGRKWNVQIALISQALEDFSGVMVEFATSIFIMDAGPAQTIKRSAEIFGLSPTAQFALKTRVHGPRAGGATFLAQFATKEGMNTQLLTNTIGPIELWAFSTTAEDASLRNKLYKRLTPGVARRVLARLFPNGSIKPIIEKRLAVIKEDKGFIEDDQSVNIIDELVDKISAAYTQNPDMSTFQAE